MTHEGLAGYKTGYRLSAGKEGSYVVFIFLGIVVLSVPGLCVAAAVTGGL